MVVGHLLNLLVESLMVHFSVSVSFAQVSDVLVQRLIVQFRVFSKVVLLGLLMARQLFLHEEVLFELGSNFRDTLIRGQIRVLNFDFFLVFKRPILGMIATFVVQGR